MPTTRRNNRILHLLTRLGGQWGGMVRKIAGLKWTLLPLATLGMAATLLLMVSLGERDIAPPRGDDPAMQNAAVKVVSPSTDPTVEPQATVVDSQIPKREDGRVFFPELGWLDEPAFWEMYTNEPEKLPDSLDLYAAHQLRQEYEREREAEGET